MTDEARLQRWIASRGGGTGPSSSNHIDMDTLTAHARGELGAQQARLVEEHLYVCEDGRCPDFVREAAAGAYSQEPSSNGAVSSGGSSGGVHNRTFQSREIIWGTFESMSRELDVSIDVLVNEAMTAYARVRGYPVPDDVTPQEPPHQVEQRRPAAPQHHPHPRRDPFEETQDAGAVISALDRSYSPARAPEDPEEDDLARTSTRGAAFVRPGAGGGGRAPQLPNLPAPIDPLEPGEETRTAPRMNSPIPKGRMPSPAPPRQPHVIEPYAAKPPPLPPRSFPPTTMPMPGAPPQRREERRLTLTYQGRANGVDKDRYLIGRSKTQADLRLDDPNVSRQHAVIEKVGSAYYLVDLGSTNGVHIAGERVARRALVDGDVITITSHEIRVSLR